MAIVACKRPGVEQLPPAKVIWRNPKLYCFLRLTLKIGLGLGFAIQLISCSATNSGTLPSANQSPSSPKQAYHDYVVGLNAARQADGEATGPIPAKLSFSSLSGQKITMADIDRFIDPDVTGHDKGLAERFMASQPEGSRGDFIYLDPSGRVISNRDALRDAYARQANVERVHQVQVGHKTMLYPPVADSSQGGPFYREYSTLGITAGFGFVTIPCDDEMFFQGDSGDAYFGENGSINGQTEGGVQVTNSPPMTLQSPSIQVYGRSTYYPRPGYTTVTNPTHYSCGSPLFVSYGQLSPPNLGYFFASAGIPQYDPTVYQIPGGTIFSTNVAYVYANVPSDFFSAGIDGTGTYTPCIQCYIRRMDSIAQAVYNPYSGECFGMCRGYLTIRWDQIYMGQLTQYFNAPQPSGGFVISDTFKVSGENWFGGVQYFPDMYRVQSSTANLPASTINWDYEGLNLTMNNPVQVQANGIFRQLQPQPTPVPTPVPTKDPRTGPYCGSKICW